MAIEWVDAFAIGSVAGIVSRYDVSDTSSMAIASSGGRTGQYLTPGGGYIEKYRRDNAGNLIPSDGVIVGIARYLNTNIARELIILKDSAGDTQITLTENNDGTLSIYRGNSTTGTLLATTIAIATEFWVYYELKVIIHDTLGSYHLRVNEVTLASATGVDTKNTTLTNIGRVMINGRNANGGTSVLHHWDDLYIANLSQPIPASGFYGNTKVEHLTSEGAGDITGWSPFPSNVSNWDNVNENPHDSDTSYNYASTTNASDLYTMQNMSASTDAAVRAVQVSHVSRKDDALSRVVAPLVRTGGVTYPGNNDSLTTSYVYYQDVWNWNPNTSAPWTVPLVNNSLQCGIQVTG